MLFVCTGNVCRSPMAENLFDRALVRAGIDARVRSAGLAPGGQPPSPLAVEIMGERGIDLGDHRSQRLTEAMVGRADLVVGMAREHVREVVGAAPAAFARTYTLKELVRRGVGAGPRREGEPMEFWLERVGEGRTRNDLLGASPVDDLADPYTQPRTVYDQIATDIDRLVQRLTWLLFPDAAEGDAR